MRGSNDIILFDSKALATFNSNKKEETLKRSVSNIGLKYL